MSSTIYVSGIHAGVSEKEIKDFLSFCGRIQELKLEADGSNQKATVVFEKASAAKTALLLDNTTLKSQEIHVTSGGDSTTTTEHHTETHEGDEIRQEDKPKTRVFAEYLAHGYTFGDNVLQKAIELDSKHGVSNKFLSTIQGIDNRTKASSRAADLDAKYKVTEQARSGGQSAWLGLSSYFEKFSSTAPGQKVVAFYSSGEKQVKDIHEEALRLSGLKEKYQASSTGTSSEKKFEPESVPGGTKCGCGGEDSVCGCKAGACKCASCPKSDNNQDSAPATFQTTNPSAVPNITPVGEKQA